MFCGMEQSRIQKGDVADEPHRRGRSRLRTMLPARLSTLFGTWPAYLRDISLTGAGVELRDIDSHGLQPPKVGGEVVLEWEAGEAFGRIVRIRGNILGLAFDEIVPPPVLIATRDLHDALVARGGLNHLVKENARRFVQGRRAW